MGASVLKRFNLRAVLLSLSRTFVRQVRFPTFMRALVESLLFCSVFLAAGFVSLGHTPVELLQPMVPVVLIMMLSMVFSGVYRKEITNSIMNLYWHSFYGFALATAVFLLIVPLIGAEFSSMKFKFFFLFFAFFVINTMRPLISGTDFMDGGGRRTN